MDRYRCIAALGCAGPGGNSGSKAPARNQPEPSPESTYDETHCWLAQALYAAKLDRLSAQNPQ